MGLNKKKKKNKIEKLFVKMAELPFRVMCCKACKRKFKTSSLRIFIMLQSAFTNGKKANWHYKECLCRMMRVKSISDVANYNKLEQADKERIKKTIENNTGIVLPEAKGEERKGKRAAEAMNPADQDFAVEYSKSSQATCKLCEIKICKDEVSICKIMLDTEVGMKYGGRPFWYHVKCFEEERDSLGHLAGGESLPGFNNLNKEDQKIVKNTIKSKSEDDVPQKKLKIKPKDEEETKKEEENEELLQKQNEEYHKYRNALYHCSKKELQKLLEKNSQEISEENDECLDRLADCMAFGVLEPCPECKGQLVLDTFNYKCTGNISEGMKCCYTTTDPKRRPFLVPNDFKESPTFSGYKPKVMAREFEAAPPLPPPIVLEAEDLSVKKNISIQPLKNLEFFIYGELQNNEAIKNRILELGGLVVSELTDTLAAVVSNETSEKMRIKMKEIRKRCVEVVRESFLDLIDPVNGTVGKTLQLIRLNNVAPWGSYQTTRILLLNGNSFVQRLCTCFQSQKYSTTTGHAAVDPDSGLETVAHVYRSPSGNEYTVTLCRTDVDEQNSYYKLQLLESNYQKRYWLFRAWGRLGTNIGSCKVEDYESLLYAIRRFEHIYMEKTENLWQYRHTFMQVRNYYFPFKVDYKVDKPELLQVDQSCKLLVDQSCKLLVDQSCKLLVDQSSKLQVEQSSNLQVEQSSKLQVEQSSKLQVDQSSKLQVEQSSKLSEPVQKLVLKIFDINIMKKTLSEYELDTEKMPLANLCKKQIKAGYQVLSQLHNHIEKGKATENKIVDATNRFFTTIPHNFGGRNAPLLNSVEAIKKKTEMLDNLWEIEIAYSLMQTISDKETSPIDQYYLKLKADIAPLSRESYEFNLIELYVANTHDAAHSNYTLEIQEVFKVVREGEDKRFQRFKDLYNRRLLWHGSRATNFAGILSQGLRIAPPEAPVTGYNFGKGVYFSDIVSKSADNCCTTMANPVGIVLLCEVALGHMKPCHKAEIFKKLPPGQHSVWGVGRTQPDPTQNKILKGGIIIPMGTPVTNNNLNTTLLYNEFVVYDVAQVNVKYLVQMKFSPK